MSDVVIVFAKFPRPGVVKTRLAQSIGEVPAADFYKTCCEHVFAECGKLPASITTIIYCADESDRVAIREWLGDRVALRTQASGDIGERMEQAFVETFAEGASHTVLVGTDIPGLRATHVMQAIELLNDNNVVLGPARDGGYYLIAMSAAQPVFSGIEWSTHTVAESTRKKIHELGLRCVEIEMLEDVDTQEDYVRFSVRKGE